MIRVEIIADRSSTAEDLARLLVADGRIEVIAASGAGEYSHLSRESDVLLAVKLLPAQIPKSAPPVVVLSEDPGSRPEPAHASLPLHSSPVVIVAAITAAAAGLYTFTPDQLPPSATPRGQSPSPEKLTTRELEVLNLMAEGLSNKEIAGYLHISGHTAKFHVAQVLAKLAVATRTEAVRIGMRRGLISL